MSMMPLETPDSSGVQVAGAARDDVAIRISA